MAYTSDLRIKNIIKNIDKHISERLKSLGLDELLELRIFDESNEDAKLWEQGGLSFKDPVTGMSLGSNDAGWSIDGNPLVIVEGTFGTERGQFGDGQLNRASHSLGPALNGYIGVTFVPYRGQSFIKKGSRKDLLSKNINYQSGLLRKELAILAVNISQNYEGKYLIVDPYDSNLLEELTYNAVLDYYKKNNILSEIIQRIIAQLARYSSQHELGKRSNQTISTLYNDKGEIVSTMARFYTHNLESLTTSEKRDGHGLLGKNLIELYLKKGVIFSIFIRLDKKDFDILKSRNGKEINFIFKNPKIVSLNFDDLVFDSKDLMQKVCDFRKQNLHQDTNKSFIKEIQVAFNSGKIRIKS